MQILASNASFSKRLNKQTYMIKGDYGVDSPLLVSSTTTDMRHPPPKYDTISAQESAVDHVRGAVEATGVRVRIKGQRVIPSVLPSSHPWGLPSLSSFLQSSPSG